MKLLLCSVFGPYAVDDEFGRKENVMELFHNQVTREQGIFSMRMNHESGGLHLMAENVSVPTVVLDFPSQARFIAEIRKGYDYVGISFIVPNFLKAKRMAGLVRKHSPGTKIILGGHGTSIKNIETLIPCDHVCRGEGVRFLRQLFNNDVDAPVRHPLKLASVNKHVMGVPAGSRDSGLIFTGVGCVNECRFCCTTHYFQKKYTSFIKTGKEMFDICAKMEKKFNIQEFFVMDENFLKNENRVRELVAEMEKHGKAYSFNIFSSAEAVTRMGLDFIERLGVNFLWMGVESKKEVYEKNRDIDFKRLIKNLRDRGVSVLASGILFLEHHSKTTIHDDIDFLTGLQSDFVQFMQLGPLPGTSLFNDYEKQDKLLKELPYEEWHGQHQLWFRHPHFTGPESAIYLKEAFKKDFRENGPSILRLLDTSFRGVISSREHSSDPFMKKRHKQRVDRALEMYPLLDSLCFNAPDHKSRQLARDVRQRYSEYFGRMGMGLRIKSATVQVLTQVEKVRNMLVYNNMRQPGTVHTPYRMSLARLKDASFTGKKTDAWNFNTLYTKIGFNHVPVHLSLSGILDSKNIRTLQSAIITFLKKEEKALILNLSNLQKIDEHALRKFFTKLNKYRHLLQLIYSEHVESTRIAMENLKSEFTKINFVAV